MALKMLAKSLTQLRNTETTGEKTVLQNPTAEPSTMSGEVLTE